MASDGGDTAECQEQSPDLAARLETAMKVKEEGAELYKQHQFNEARDKWAAALQEISTGEEVSSLNRLKLSLHLNLAQVALQLGHYDEVVTQTTAAVKLDPENSKAFYRRGLAYGSLGKCQAAAVDFHKAARLEPRSAEIRKKYEEFKKKAAEVEAEEWTPPHHDLIKLPQVFLDISVGEKPSARMVFVLYADTVPKTAENFRQLCTEQHEGVTARGKPFTYRNSILHRKIPGLMVQGGDFENENGTGGESIYGRRFEDEAFRDKHTRRGLLAMANDGPNTNGSNFFVSFAPAEHLDRRHVIFGELIQGFDLLDMLEDLPTNPEHRPLDDCVITACGELTGNYLVNVASDTPDN